MSRINLAFITATSEESLVEFNEVDYRFAGKFIAANMSQEQMDNKGLTRIVPGGKLQSVVWEEEI